MLLKYYFVILFLFDGTITYSYNLISTDSLIVGKTFRVGESCLPIRPIDVLYFISFEDKNNVNYYIVNYSDVKCGLNITTFKGTYKVEGQRVSVHFHKESKEFREDKGCKSKEISINKKYLFTLKECENNNLQLTSYDFRPFDGQNYSKWVSNPFWNEYEDTKTKEKLMIDEYLGEGLQVLYSSKNYKEPVNLIVETYDRNKLYFKVRFPHDTKIYKLKLNTSTGILSCFNPDGSIQNFISKK